MSLTERDNGFITRPARVMRMSVSVGNKVSIENAAFVGFLAVCMYSCFAEKWPWEIRRSHMSIYIDTPYVFTPNPSADNGPQLQSVMKAGYRWIQINGTDCPIGTTVLLNRDDNWPYSGQIIEPAPGIDKVTIDVSGIGRNPLDPTDPSYAAIDYQGNVRPGSYLTAPAYVNTTEISVADTTPYTNGSWIVISDASTDFATYPMPLDGPLEVRQVIYVLANSLIVNRVIKRDHPLGAIVALCDPIKNVYIRNLEFTGDAAVGLHLHYAQHCVIENITSVDWTGRCMLLLDNGGEYNTILDSYCTATEPGVDPEQTAWGVVIEGQDSTRVINSGGENCGLGMGMNYSIDCVSINARARLNTVNVGVYTASIRTGFLRPATESPLILDNVITSDCVDCYMVEPIPFS
ncbi:hypothetical protein [Pseudomonas sp. IPO3774]|uniref:hypothetical protein n=1 Tax=Pseudomonas sp. IPO3774 TaxID=2738826 RepID=UPI00210DCBCD|nr:hypothetical protein [Pseudomonas sp. IPO3774]